MSEGVDDIHDIQHGGGDGGSFSRCVFQGVRVIGVVCAGNG